MSTADGNLPNPIGEPPTSVGPLPPALPPGERERGGGGRGRGRGGLKGHPRPLLPFQCLRLTAKNFAAAPSVPRGFKLHIFWPAIGGDHRGTLGGGGVPADDRDPM